MLGKFREAKRHEQDTLVIRELPCQPKSAHIDKDRLDLWKHDIPV